MVTRISSTTFAFAPGSKRIAHMCLERQRSRVLSVCVSNLNGSKRKVLTHPKGLGTIEEEPAWSHDGRWIAFTHTVNADRANSQSFIYIVNVNGTGLHRVREQPACASGTGSLRDADSPDWGPKGRLVFECPAGLYVAESPFALAHPLGCSSACSPGFRSCRGLEPSFSPDGARIAISNVGIQTITAMLTVTDGASIAMNTLFPWTSAGTSRRGRRTVASSRSFSKTQTVEIDSCLSVSPMAAAIPTRILPCARRNRFCRSRRHGASEHATHHDVQRATRGLPSLGVVP